MKAASLSRQGHHLDRGCEEGEDAGLKNGWQQGPEVKPNSAQAHTAIHAVLHHRCQASTFPHPGELLCQYFKIEHAA